MCVQEKEREREDEKSLKEDEREVGMEDEREHVRERVGKGGYESESV